MILYKLKCVCNMSPECAEIIIKYHSTWSVALFTSSITLASFLFTMKSFIIQTVKEKIYDTEDHQKKVAGRRKSGENTEYYGGLRRLASLLKWTIISALINAVMQLSLSGFAIVWLSLLCLIVSLITALLFGTVVLLVSQNINDMIQASEKKMIDQEYGQNKSNK